MASPVRVPLIDAAVDQLDWAIRLFLDHNAFVPAITLAGAAEGILDTMVKQGKGSTASMNISDSLQAKGYKEEDMKLMNQARNVLKHGPEKHRGRVFAGDSDEQIVQLEPESEAIQMIARAMINLVAFDRSATSEMPRFWEWLHRNRSDLLS